MNEQIKPMVGMGVTQYLFSDSYAYTIIGISKNGKKLTIQKDKATLDPSFKPEFNTGGFLAHCTNQESQKYSYERDQNGIIYEVSLRSNGQWKMVGSSSKCSIKFKLNVRRTFHDYNF